MNTCLNCGKEFEGRSDAKYCSDKCRMSYKRDAKPNIKRTEPEIKANTLEVKPNKTDANTNTLDSKANKSVRDNRTLFGRPYAEIDPKDEFRLGDEMWGQVFTKETLPSWMFDGDAIHRGRFLNADETRKTFREMMLQYDMRFGARKNGELIAMGEM